METTNDLENKLREMMSPNHLEQPNSKLVADARKKIMARKKPSTESSDFFAMLAAFLNFKVKLYQAVLASLILAGMILIFNREDNNRNNDTSSDYMSNIASVGSSTVLSSIYTFGLNKKPYDERSSN